MSVIRSVVLFVRALLSNRAELAAENLALRQQLAVLQQKSKRPGLRKRDRIGGRRFRFGETPDIPRLGRCGCSSTMHSIGSAGTGVTLITCAGIRLPRLVPRGVKCHARKPATYSVV